MFTTIRIFSFETFVLTIITLDVCITSILPLLFSMSASGSPLDDPQVGHQEDVGDVGLGPAPIFSLRALGLREGGVGLGPILNGSILDGPRMAQQ